MNVVYIVADPVRGSAENSATGGSVGRAYTTVKTCSDQTELYQVIIPSASACVLSMFDPSLATVYVSPGCNSDIVNVVFPALDEFAVMESTVFPDVSVGAHVVTVTVADPLSGVHVIGYLVTVNVGYVLIGAPDIIVAFDLSL